ncbi:unnamed protein product, partial [Cylindrotheca closterium]
MTTINGQQLFTGGTFDFTVQEQSVNFDFLDSDHEDYDKLKATESARFTDSGEIIEPSEAGEVEHFVLDNIQPVQLQPVQTSQFMEDSEEEVEEEEEEFVIN